jgi:hypothetical protein
MNRTEAMSWVLSVCASLRLSQAKTLSQLVVGAMGCQRVSLAAIGRKLRGAAKHQIKKCWRFCVNERVETADAMRGVVGRLLKRRKKPLLVSLDWTDIRGFQTLMASAVIRGRSIPLCWASCRAYVYEGHRSRNAFEESLLLVLRSMIPRRQRVILLADRGFGRTELARFCQAQHFDYVIRIQPDVRVQCASYTGKLLDYPVRKGMCKRLQSVAYRSHHPVTQHIVIRWVRNLPKTRDECWFLMTSLEAGPARISTLYGRRMTIEELFRDHKSKRNGWSLRDTQLTRPDRLDRMLLILALAYLLLCGLGLLALKTGHPRQWSSNNRSGECSVFVIGQIMLHRLKATPAQAWTALRADSERVTANWG